MESAVLKAVERGLVEHFGHVPVRASVSFLGVEPIEILRFEPIPGERAYLSLGMSRHPMSSAADPVMAADGPRAELMLHVRDPRDSFADVWRKLAVLAAAPAVEGVVYTAGMSLDLGEALAPGTACTGVVVEDSAVAAIETASGAVAVYRVSPATQAELAWCRVRGSAELRTRWDRHAVDLLDLARSAVPLGD